MGRDGCRRDGDMGEGRKVWVYVCEVKSEGWRGIEGNYNFQESG